MHTKSKYVNSGERMWTSKDPKEKQEFIAKSVRNRRRIAAECMRLRLALDRVCSWVDIPPPLLAPRAVRSGW
jgi:hypothetical protein